LDYLKMKEIIDYSLLDAVELYNIRRYSDLVNKTLEAAEKAGFSAKSLKKLNEKADFLTDGGRKIWVFEKGNPECNVRFLFKGGCHGPESASSKALYLLIKSFARIKQDAEDFFISVILADDPDGFDTETKIFVNRTGDEQHYPPTSKLQEWWEDVNGTWGKSSSERIEILKRYIRGIKPTHAVDFHETFHGLMPFLVFGNAGIMSIEDFHLEDEELKRLLKCKIPKNMFWKFIYSIYDALPFKNKIQPQKELRNNHDFYLGKRIMDHVREKGFKTYPVKYPAVLNVIGSPFPLDGFSSFNPFHLRTSIKFFGLEQANPREIPIDYARFVEGFPLRDADIKICSRWMFEEFGTHAFTTETFAHGNEDGGITERVGEDLAFAEGLILSVLAEGERR